MRKEDLTHNPESKETQIMCRAIVFSLPTADELYKELQKGSPSIIRIYIPQKHGVYTLFGGKIKDSEHFSEAVQRKIMKELGCATLGMPKHPKIGEWINSEGRTILTVCPILPERRIIIGDPSIESVKQATVEEFEQLIHQGYLDGIPLESNLKIRHFSREDANLEKTLDRALKGIRIIENALKERIMRIAINNGEVISPESFANEYQKIISDFMRRGVTIAIPEKPIKERKNPIHEALNGGHLGKDILYFLPEVAKHGINWAGIERAPESLKVFINFIHGSFLEFLKIQGISEQEYQSFIRDENVSLETKLTFIDAFDVFFRQALKDMFQVSDEDIEDAEYHAQRFFEEISKEIKVADHSLSKGLYQDFASSEEVDKANIGQLINIFLYHKSNGHYDNIIRFEAGRKLLLLFKYLTGINHYREEIKKVRKSKLRQALQIFFGAVCEEISIQIDEDSLMRVRIRKKENERFIIDEKPIKPPSSYIRKTFEESSDSIHDVHSVNIVFLEENKQQSDVDNLIDSLSSFFEKQFPSYEISTEKKECYGSDSYFCSSADNLETIKISGKRRGSQGSRLVRTKLFFVLRDKKTKEEVERLDVVIYPVYSTEKKNKHLWGWLEKIKDDKHYTLRRLFTGKNGIPSLFHLLYPPEFYPHNYQCKLRSQFYRD